MSLSQPFASPSTGGPSADDSIGPGSARSLGRHLLEFVSAHSAEPSQVVQRALELARVGVGLESAYVAELAGGQQKFLQVAGKDVGMIQPGGRLPEQESYCHHMLAGEVPNAVGDVRGEPALRDLPLTREAGLGAYVGVAVPPTPGSPGQRTLCCVDRAPHPELGAAEVCYLGVLAGVLQTALEHEHSLAAERQLREDRMVIIAHEVRGPLACVRGAAELLRHEDGEQLSPSGRDLLAVIDRSASRLESLAAQMLTAGRLDAGILPGQMADVDLERVVAEEVSSCQSWAGPAGIGLSASLVDGARVRGDRAWLAQLIDNLVINAIKFSGPDGEVVVMLRREGNEARLDVSDSGPGMSADQCRRVFDRYWTGERACGDGAGLGLWIAKAIVDAHSGRISISSQPGHGSIVSMWLPALGAER